MEQNFGVAVKGIIENKDGKYLILYKSDNEDINPNSFDIPGGRILFGEKLEDAIIREIKEETNLDISVIKISRAWGFVKGELHLVGITFLVKCDNYDTINLSEEHTNHFWKTKQEILEGAFPGWLKEEISAI